MQLRNLLIAAFAAQAMGEAWRPQLTAAKVEADVTQKDLKDVLVSLEKIATDNGGNRAFGYQGYNASMDFVLDRVQKRFGRYMDTKIQKFTHLFDTTRKIELTGPDGKKVPTKAWMYNVATPLPEGITAELLDTPVDDKRGSMCYEDMWKDIKATGKIVLMKRGTCPNFEKVKLAKKYGAKAAVIYNPEAGDDIPVITLGADNQALIVPVAPITLGVAQDWKKRLADGEKLSVNVLVDCIVENRDSWNIISETKQGDANNVVMLGAHLDSVAAGPGINDDGSGVAALLNIVASLSKYSGIKNKVRFAWWGTEESGLVGSLYYTKNLTSAEADKIKFYFNYDMIGSPEPNYEVYADNDAHKYGGKHIFDYLKSKGHDAKYGKFGTSSDYVGFLKLGIPSSGIFTGAGKPFDPNYHTAKDDLKNINWTAMVANSKAAGRAAAELALSLEGVPPRQRTSNNPRSAQSIARGFSSWAKVSSASEKQHSCGSHSEMTI